MTALEQYSKSQASFRINLDVYSVKTASIPSWARRRGSRSNCYHKHWVPAFARMTWNTYTCRRMRNYHYKYNMFAN